MDVNNQGIVDHLVANADVVADGVEGDMRLDRHGESIVQSVYNGMQQSATEGAYIGLAAAGTIDTGITMSVATGTSFSATQAIMVIFNDDPVKELVLDYFKLYQITVDTTGVLQRIIHYLDRGNRYASGGTAMTLGNASGNGQNPAIFAYAGAVVATAATSAARLLGSNIIANGVGAKGIELTIRYAAQEVAAGFTIPATTVASYSCVAPPIVIPPGWSYVANEFKTGRGAAGTGEFYAGLIAR